MHIYVHIYILYLYVHSYILVCSCYINTKFFFNNIMNWLDWKMYEFIVLLWLLIVCVNIDNLIIPYFIISIKII